MRTHYTLYMCAVATGLALSPFVSEAQSRADVLAGKSVRRHGVSLSELRGGGAPANDDCTAPETLTVGEDCASPTPGDNTNATQSEVGPACDDASTGIWADVWYTFNSGSNTSVDVDLVPGETMTDYVLVVLDACGGTELLCYVLPPAAQSVEVTENTDYIVRIYSNTQYGDPGPFTICVSATPPPPPPPANDDCGSAIVLTANADCVPTDGYSFGATESQPADSCNGYLGTANDDVWYTFVAMAAEMTISVQGGDGFDAVVELFEGDCSGLSEIGCADATVGGELEEIAQGGLVVGNSYLVRLFNYGGTEVSPSSFTICAAEGLSGIGMDEAAGAVGTEPFPNPAEGPVNITWSGAAADVRMDVLDMTGRCAHTELRHLSKGQVTVMSLGDLLPAGAYSIRLTGGGTRITHRLVIH